MKKINKIKMAVLSLAFFTATACGGESEAISIVKKGKLGQLCLAYTVEEMVNASMEKPKWKHSVGKNGVDYVTVSGLIVTGRPTEGVWQLWVRNGTFGSQALELDKKPQNDLGVINLVSTMCRSADAALGKQRRAEEQQKRAEEQQKAEAARVAEQQKAETALKAKAEGVKKGSFTDIRDGKTYKTVKLDNQTWMAENLNYDAKDSKCYDNKSDNCKKYGRLYDWETAKKACPNGWHLPSKKEWETLDADSDKKAGNRLKAKSGWSNNGNGTDDYSFSALPGGGYSDGFGISAESFYSVGNYGYWWSGSKYGDDAYHRIMSYESEDARWDYGSGKSYSFSVRCIQD